MKIKHTLETIVIIGGLTILAACKSSAPTVDPSVMLNYCKESTNATLESLSKSYGSVINKSRKTGLKQSSIYSDYAVTLVKLGKREEANSWFNKEMEAFPASKHYVMQLKKELIPEYVNDNSIKVNEASVETEENSTEVKQQNGNENSTVTATTGKKHTTAKPKSKKKSKRK